MCRLLQTADVRDVSITSRSHLGPTADQHDAPKSRAAAATPAHTSPRCRPHRTPLWLAPRTSSTSMCAQRPIALALLRLQLGNAFRGRPCFLPLWAMLLPSRLRCFPAEHSRSLAPRNRVSAFLVRRSARKMVRASRSQRFAMAAKAAMAALHTEHEWLLAVPELCTFPWGEPATAWPCQPACVAYASSAISNPRQLPPARDSPPHTGAALSLSHQSAPSSDRHPCSCLASTQSQPRSPSPTS